MIDFLNSPWATTLDHTVRVARRLEQLNLVGVAVRWNVAFGNAPDVCFYTHNALPRDVDLLWDRNGSRYFGATARHEDFFCRFYSWRGPGSDGGSCHARVPLPMTDGTTADLIGPWVGCVRDWHTDGGFPLAKECTVYNLENGHAWLCAVSEPLLRWALRRIDTGIHLLSHTRSYALDISLDPDTVVKPADLRPRDETCLSRRRRSL